MMCIFHDRLFQDIIAWEYLKTKYNFNLNNHIVKINILTNLPKTNY